MQYRDPPIVKYYLLPNPTPSTSRGWRQDESEAGIWPFEDAERVAAWKRGLLSEAVQDVDVSIEWIGIL